MSETCRACGQQYEPGEEPDPCLGLLPGVFEACCGHGKRHKSYVYFENGMLVRGFFRVEQHDPQYGEGHDLHSPGEPPTAPAPDAHGEQLHEDSGP